MVWRFNGCFAPEWYSRAAPPVQGSRHRPKECSKLVNIARCEFFYMKFGEWYYLKFSLADSRKLLCLPLCNLVHVRSAPKKNLPLAYRIIFLFVSSILRNNSIHKYATAISDAASARIRSFWTNLLNESNESIHWILMIRSFTSSQYSHQLGYDV